MNTTVSPSLAQKAKEDRSYWGVIQKHRFEIAAIIFRYKNANPELFQNASSPTSLSKQVWADINKTVREYCLSWVENYTPHPAEEEEFLSRCVVLIPRTQMEEEKLSEKIWDETIAIFSVILRS